MGPSFTERRNRISVLGWPTDVIGIDPKRNSGPQDSPVHTILFWIPGNPGQHDWYNSDFVDVLSKLGDGYAVRSVSHAGHGLFEKVNGDYRGMDGNSIIDVKDYCRLRGKTSGIGSVSPFVPWTVEGQVLHKIAYMDYLMSSIEKESKTQSRSNYGHRDERSIEFSNNVKFILIGHSFGCHVIQRMCVLRPDILERVSGCLFLMPYIRTKPSSPLDQQKLEFGAARPELLISIATKLSETIRYFPDYAFRSLIRKQLGTSDGGTKGQDERIVGVTAKLLRHPSFPRNFFELGTEELRDIPNELDVAALRLLSSCRSSLHAERKKGDSSLGTAPRPKHRPICMLFAGDNDQWCPSFHGEEIKMLQSANLLPRSITTTKMYGLRHDYVCQNRAVRARVNDWIVSNIVAMHHAITNDVKSRSKLAGGIGSITVTDPTRTSVKLTSKL